MKQQFALILIAVFLSAFPLLSPQLGLYFSRDMSYIGDLDLFPAVFIMTFLLMFSYRSLLVITMFKLENNFEK